MWRSLTPSSATGEASPLSEQARFRRPTCRPEGSADPMLGIFILRLTSICVSGLCGVKQHREVRSDQRTAEDWRRIITATHDVAGAVTFVRRCIRPCQNGRRPDELESGCAVLYRSVKTGMSGTDLRGLRHSPTERRRLLTMLVRTRRDLNAWHAVTCGRPVRRLSTLDPGPAMGSADAPRARGKTRW